MKTKKRNWLALLLALCLCLGLSPLLAPTAAAADLTYEVTGGKLYFDAATGTITKGDKTITEADIPAEIYGVPVTTIHGDAFYNNHNLTRVTIPDSVTTIKDSTFSGCDKLTEIVIPDSVTTVGWRLFSSCYSLSSVTLGSGLTAIPREMFSGCKALKSITIPDNITAIGFEAFQYSGLESITIPDSVTSIGGSAFDNCASLTSVYMPDSVTSLGDCAFMGCDALTDVRLSRSLTTLPRDLFWGSDALESVEIPDGVTTIDSIFRFCSGLKTVTIPKSVTIIDSSAFYRCESMTDVYYGAGPVEWSQIKMGSLNDGIDRSAIHFSDYVSGFTDVFEADYYGGAVEWAVGRNVTTGYTADTFAPERPVTRAQAVTFLWRAAGCPEPSSTVSPFTDVTDPDAYYYEAVLWAAEQGITTGATSTTFNRNGTLSYNHILAFLCRAAGGDANGSGWAAKAAGWAAENGLTDGLTFSGGDDCPRADVVYCLWKQLG